MKGRLAVVVLYIGLQSIAKAFAQPVQLTTIHRPAWAKNSVNTVIFRKNSLTSYKDHQYAAFYDTAGFVVLASRKLFSPHWTINKTQYTGDATDAHKSISIITDGDGYLHVAWGQHNNPLNYAKGVSPGSLTLGQKLPMIAKQEGRLSYPEFYRLPGGNLLFLYRDGGSGNGNLLMNRYDVKLRQWARVQNNLIDGERQRSAYWQMAVDSKGTLHLSWVWRETPDVSSNHDMGYACSKDGGVTWQKSTGETYKLPITASTAEYACRIPQNSNLINQTSIAADDEGRPYIATYYRDKDSSATQYHIIYRSALGWQVKALNIVGYKFDLKGIGTKAIPISRPQLVTWGHNHKTAAALIFRDEKNGGEALAAITDDIKGHSWKLRKLLTHPVGLWEPTYDTELWNTKGVLSLFIQKVSQVDAEGQSNLLPQPVQVLEWNIKKEH